MKLFKLWVHQQTFSEDPLIVNPKEFPNERVGDILEIYHPEEENTRLLLQIKSIRHDFQQKDTISVEQSVANIFQLRTYWDVQVNKVNPKDVVVDLVELLIKDQYVSRSDMWRLSSSITDVCVYISKKIQFAGIRAQVSEIWIKDQKVSCGVISESTRVVFRSSSSLMYLFIQMSQEMWDFGLNGDLYFEKTVNCFLHELFTHWRESFTNQEVTIILFSRTFYNAQSLDEFPEEMRKSVQQNPRGQFYEDFYQVVVHGERRDDWLPVLAVLKRYFTLYPKYINCCENLDGVLLGMNSTSYAGNFLEAINLSMNIFERYHIDRTFDCTGQTVVIVTPGTGAFEVDRELSSLTKQRMIDSGVSADLVCMAEQPLHTVPLLKFFNKGEGQTSSLGDDYSIPHWINHSFYSLPNSRTAARSAYVPRIRVPDIILNYFGKDSVDIPLCEGPCYNSQNYSEHDEQPNQILDFVDYDDYDIKVFRKSSAKSRDKTRKTLLLSRKGHSSHHDVETLGQSGTFPEIVDKYEFSPEDKVGIPVPSKAVPQRQTNQHQSRLATSAETALSERVGLYGRKAASDDNVQYLNMGLEKQSAFMVGSVGTVLSHFRTDHRAPQRGLINPFKPSVIPCKWTCNRHRWSDAFPEGPGGESLFRHHTKITAADAEEGMTLKWNSVEEAGSTVVSARQNTLSDVQKSTLEEFEDRSNEEKKADSFSTLYELSPPNLKASFETIPTAIRRYNLARPSHQHINVHVEKDWAAALKTSVDWKSLVTPAILPLTTNYFPDKRTLNKSYLEYNYELWIEFDEKYGLAAERLKLSQRKESGEEDMRVGRRLLSPDQIFEELVSQRLAKGFQICRSKSSKSCDPDSRPEIRPTFSAMMARDDQSNEVLMCLGRITHKIHLSRQQSQILVTRYHPRHPLNLEAYHYVYRLGTSMQRCASVACATFSYEELYKYNWNYLDHYICGDDQDFNELLETLKYFKSRFLILPSLSTGKGSDVGQVEPRHTRNKKQREEWARVEGLMRFLEGLNRIKASSVKRRPLSPKEKRSTRTIDRKVSCVEAGSKSGSLGASKTLTQETPRSSESNSLPKEVTTTQMSVILNESKDNSESDLLSVQSSLEKIAEAMSATTNGLTFLPELKALNPVPSFLSIEAVSWMIQHVSGVSSRNEAVALGQKMLEANIIQHASGSKKQKFVDGFLIYSMLSKTPLGTESSKANSSSCKNPLEEERHQVDLLTNFRSEWFEVAVWMSKTDNSNVSFLAPNELISCFNFDGSGSLRTSGRIQTSIRRSMSISKQLGSRECDYVPAYKTVFLDADPHCKSNRPERCTVRYHGNYSPDHAFEIEVHWIAATGSIVCEMVGKELSEKRGSDFERILSTIEDYISQRKKTHVAALRVWSTDNPHPQEEYLDCLWAQMKNLKSNNWQEKHIRRPYLAFDSVLADALQHVLPTVSLPPHKEEVTYPLPTVVYRMFDYTDVPEGPAMPGAHSIERFLVEEAIRRVINAHSKDRKECANQLVNMYGRSKVPHNYCIVEVLFSEMLRLPETQHIHVYYGSLFIELCKLQQSAMPGVLAQATELIFDRLDTMNTTCIDRFVDWFSYHLSNFHFKWSWDDWLSASENPDLPRYRFLYELFEKLKRLMYQQFVTQLLPEGLQPLVPPAPEPLYRFTPDKTELPGVDIAKQLLEAIKAKKDQDELQTILNEISHNATGQPDSNDATELSFPALRIEVLLQTLLKLGSKSISHTFNALTKFQKLIMDLVTNEEAQVHVLRTVKEFWQDHPQMLVVLVNKLLKMQIVESASVVNWLLGKDMTDDFMRKYTWEIMAETLKKMNSHTSQVEKQVQDAKRGLEVLEEKAKKEVENGDQEDEKVKQLKAKLQEETEKKQQLIEELTEKLENAQRDQKQVFLVVFQRFILILTEHLVRCEQHQMDVNTQWFIYATDRLREILLTNHRQVFQYQATLETLLFTSDLDPHILNIFNQFKALRA